MPTTPLSLGTPLSNLTPLASTTMADHAVDDGDIYTYRGGRAPQHITHAIIDSSVYDIEDSAFSRCKNLLTVDTHDGLRRIGPYAFYGCKSLRRINLKPAVEICQMSFKDCESLETIEFGDRLEKVCGMAFEGCTSIQRLNLPTITKISAYMFRFCKRLTTVQLSERLESIWPNAFNDCERLQRIALPLKRDLLDYDEWWERYNQFDGCKQLTTVVLVEGAHNKTIASLHMESWRAELTADINRINQFLPIISIGKTAAIQQWMESLLDKLDHYKKEHNRFVKEGMTVLALARLKILEADQFEREETGVLTRGGRKRVREEIRLTDGAVKIIIGNVLPFLKLE